MAENLGNVPLEVIPLESLDAHPDNPRTDLGDLAELADSIRAQGVIAPLVAVRSGERFVIVAGHRRAEAARKAGLTTVPVLVRDDLTEAQAVEIMLVENIQRADLTPMQQARGLARLVDLGLSQREIAARTGIAQGTVSKRLALLNLSATLADKVDSGAVGVNDALTLAKAAAGKGDEGTQVVEAAARFVERGLKAEQAVEMAKREARQRQAKAEAEAFCKAAGIEIVSGSDEKSTWEQFARRDVGVHKGHSVAVVTVDGTLRLWCKSPKSHLPADAKAAAKVEADKAKEAKAAEAKAKADATLARFNAARTFLNGKTTAQVRALQAFVTFSALLQISPIGVDLGTVCDLLGLEHSGVTSGPKGEPQSAFATWQAHRDALIAGGKERDQIRAAAAVLLVRWDNRLTDAQAWGEHEVQFLRYLEEAGWSPTPWDRRKMPKARPAKAQPKADDAPKAEAEDAPKDEA